MADATVSVRYRGIEGLACPRCAKRGAWVHLTNLVERVTDHNAPEGYAWRAKPIVTQTPKREFRDDVSVDKWVKEKGVERKARLWEHRYGLACPSCNVAFNREQATYHVFEDGELPLDYWTDHEANLGLMRSRGIRGEAIAAHERVLGAIGLKRPTGGGGA